MPAINKIELEASVDLQKSVDGLMTDINASFDKTKVKNSAPALAYMDTLLEIKNDSVKIIDDCVAISKLQAAASKEKDFDDFFAKWLPIRDKFTPIHAFVTASVKKNKTVPPITDKQKSEIPPESLAVIERARETTLKWRAAAEKNFKQALANHNKMVAVCKNQVQHIKNLEAKAGANNSGAVHPAPLSSSHGAQNIASEKKAEQSVINRNNAGIRTEAQNPNSKK